MKPEEITKTKMTKSELSKTMLLLIQQLIDSEHRATLEQAARTAREMVGANREEIADAIEALP